MKILRLWRRGGIIRVLVAILTLMPKKRIDEAFIPAFCEPLALFFVVLFCELLAILLALVKTPWPNFDLTLFGTSSLFVQWVGLLSAGLLCALRATINRYALGVQVGLSYGLILLVTLIASAGASYLLAVSSWWWVVNNVVIAALVVGVAMRYFVLQYQYRLQQQAELNQRIEVLQARIRPHFLFNTLNAIATMIDLEPQKAETMTLDLADITRESMRQPTMVSLATELSLCEKYLTIEKQRFGERLQVDWQREAAAEPVQVPNLLLQPIVENAIYHGIQRRAAGGVVTIAVSGGDGVVDIVISNPLPDKTSPEVKGQQIAMENIQRRLSAVYNEKARCDIQQSNESYSVHVRVPK